MPLHSAATKRAFSLRADLCRYLKVNSPPMVVLISMIIFIMIVAANDELHTYSIHGEDVERKNPPYRVEISVLVCIGEGGSCQSSYQMR